MEPRKHAEVIKAWADGAQIETMTAIGWQAVGDSPSWAEYNEYRVKPAEPERVYPKTTMSEEEIHAAWGEPYGWKGLCAFANAAMRHAIDHGQVVTREEFNRAVGERSTRDLAIAKHVRHKCYTSSQQAIGRLDLAELVAEVGA